MSKLSVRNMKGEQVGEFDFPDDLLTYDKGIQAVHDAVVFHMAKRRAGTASTLSKGEVRGSNRKPWRQKGTGRARAGFRQSPVWRGGSVVFGPRPRSFAKKLPRKVARLAFRRALSEKIAAGQVVVLDELILDQPKTRDMAALAKNLDANKGMLVVLDTLTDTVALAARNLPYVDIGISENVTTYQLLRYPVIAITSKAMAGIEKRLRMTVERGA